LGAPSKRIVILLRAVHDCPDGSTAAIARHVSFFSNYLQIIARLVQVL